jgi:hypothetical protein
LSEKYPLDSFAKGWRTLLMKIVYVGLFLSSVTLMYFTYQKIRHHNTQVRVLSLSEYGVCFLVPENYEVEVVPDGIEYRAKKNRGSFLFSTGDFDPTYTKRPIREFEAAYKKIPNFRLAQYKIKDLGSGLALVAQEEFEFIKKDPAPLMMYRDLCERLRELHPVYKEQIN